MNLNNNKRTGIEKGYSDEEFIEKLMRQNPEIKKILDGKRGK